MKPNNRNIRLVNVHGFHHGVHLIPAAPMEKEIVAQFDADSHRVRHDTVDATKELEAGRKVLENQKPDVEKHWRQLEAETQGRRPEVAKPLVCVAVVLLAVVFETLLLAPIMDGLGIADPIWQNVAAAALVAVASVLFHIAIGRVKGSLQRESSVRKSPLGPLASAATILVAVFALAFLTILGWWRAGEMMFAAEAQQGAWAAFLHQYEFLTRIFVILLSVGLPLVAALGFDWGFDRLRYALEWRRARKAFLRVTEGIEVAQKRLEALIEKRDHRLKIIQETQTDVLETYREHYELGRRIGAQQQALWRVILNIGAVVLVIAACCVVLDMWLVTFSVNARLLLYALLTLGLGGLYAYWALKAWDRPTPTQLYRQRATVWRVPGGLAPARSASLQPSPRPSK